MAYGDVCSNPYGTAQALIIWALDNWLETEGWAVSKGCNLLELPSRRMVSLVYYRLIEDLDEEGRAKLQTSLDNAALIRDPILSPAPRRVRRRLVSVPGSPEPSAVTPAKRWRAPEGWVPAGWDERRSYESAKAFMGFKGTVK